MNNTLLRYAEQGGRSRWDDHKEDLRDIQTEIRTLTNVISNMSVKREYEGDRIKEEARRRQSEERRVAYGDGRGRPMDRDTRTRSPSGDRRPRSSSTEGQHE